MEEDEDDSSRIEQVDSERSTPTLVFEITDVDGNKAFSQELLSPDNTTTHHLTSTSTCLLPSSSLTTSNPASTNHHIKGFSPLPPPVTQDPQPSAAAVNQAPLPSGDNPNSQPKRKVQVWVLQDQGISELGVGCATEHCKEPNHVDEMVSCAGIGCNDQVCLSSMLHLVQVLISSALNSFI